jgi:hypothetical protein
MDTESTEERESTERWTVFRARNVIYSDYGRTSLFWRELQSPRLSVPSRISPPSVSKICFYSCRAPSAVWSFRASARVLKCCW